MPPNRAATAGTSGALGTSHEQALRLAGATHRRREPLVAVARALREAGGAAIDVLDADGLELVVARVEAGAVVGGMDELVQERRRRLAVHGAGALVAARLELRTQRRVPDDRPHAVARERTIEEVPVGGGVDADLVARAPARGERVQDRGHLAGLSARVDGRPELRDASWTRCASAAPDTGPARHDAGTDPSSRTAAASARIDAARVVPHFRAAFKAKPALLEETDLRDAEPGGAGVLLELAEDGTRLHVVGIELQRAAQEPLALDVAPTRQLVRPMQQIADWLEKLGLGQYALRFAENGIDLGVVPELTDEDFDRLGVLLGHRRKMLRVIAELKQAELVIEPVRRHDAERRHLTVMFCDLVGSTAMSSRLDPEDMWEVIRAYRAACARVVATYDGHIARFVGDEYTYSAIPARTRMTRSGQCEQELDIIAAIGPLKTRAEERVEVRIAIATGLVVVGDLISGSVSEEQPMVGDTPNIAARLQSLAEPGAVVVAASTRQLLGDLFTFRNLGRREVKGISEPIAVWAVEGGAASESRFEAVRNARSTGFVGRKAEIEFALSRQLLAWQGQGQVVLISGEAGIGKSRLVATLFREPCVRVAPPGAVSVLAVPHEQCASSLHRSARARPPASGQRTRLGKSSTSLRQCSRLEHSRWRQ